MAIPDKSKNAKVSTQHEQVQEQHDSERQAAEKAHEQAEHDIGEDPDLSIHSPNDDLDEGETARLGEDNIPLI